MIFWNFAFRYSTIPIFECDKQLKIPILDVRFNVVVPAALAIIKDQLLYTTPRDTVSPAFIELFPRRGQRLPFERTQLFELAES